MSDHFDAAQIKSLADCNEFQYLLLGDLRDILDETRDESDRKWLLAVLDVLVELMPQERQLHEQRGGYLANVVTEFPECNRLVQILHIKSLQLDFTLRDLRDRIRNESSWVAVADQLSCDLRDWMNMFTQVHQTESSLLKSAVPSA